MTFPEGTDGPVTAALAAEAARAAQHTADQDEFRAILADLPGVRRRAIDEIAALLDAAPTSPA